MGDLSRHFSTSEFECRDGCRYGSVHPRLVSVLEKLRARSGGKPIRIVSGLRCPPHNTAVGGASRSRHQAGEAADIPPGIVTRDEAVQAGATGIGMRGKWVVHVDVRRTREPVFWSYT